MIKAVLFSIHLIATFTKSPLDIEESYLEFIEAFKRQDLTTVLFYLDYSKAASMLLGTDLLQGQEIKEYYTSTFNSLSKVDDLEVSNIKITMLTKSTAILHCQFKELLTTTNGNKHYYEGAAMYYFEKRGQTWKITHSAGAVKCPLS